MDSELYDTQASGLSRMLTRLLTADEGPPRQLNLLHRETTVAASIDDTFAFFADAGNLQRLTPPWLHFTIRTATPIAMRVGTQIDYEIRLRGVPIPWRSIIDAWEPGVRFVDRQTIGPYRWWHHEHRFAAVRQGTLVVDHVQYLPRAAWVSNALVRRDLERIFTYRQEALPRLLASPGHR